jgi:hypothetical protein
MTLIPFRALRRHPRPLAHYIGVDSDWRDILLARTDNSARAETARTYTSARAAERVVLRVLLGATIFDALHEIAASSLEDMHTSRLRPTETSSGSQHIIGPIAHTSCDVQHGAHVRPSLWVYIDPHLQCIRADIRPIRLVSLSILYCSSAFTLYVHTSRGDLLTGLARLSEIYLQSCADGTYIYGASSSA